MSRFTSRLMAMVAHMVGFGALDDDWLEPVEVEDAAEWPAPYFLVAERPGFGWAWCVYNGASNHVVVSGLSRKRAAALCMVLNRAASGRQVV